MTENEKKPWTKRVMFKLVNGIWEVSISIKDGEYPLTPRDKNTLLRSFVREYGLDRRKRMIQNRMPSEKETISS